jgi:hypothetical protein
MIPRVGQRALALPRCRLKLLLPQRERLRAHLVLDPDLLQTLARGVVVVLRGLRGQRERALPDRLDGFDDLGGDSGEGGRVAARANAQVPPEGLGVHAMSKVPFSKFEH